MGGRDQVVIDHRRRTITGQVHVPDWGPCPAQLVHREVEVHLDFGDTQYQTTRVYGMPCTGRARHPGQHLDKLGRRWGKPDKVTDRRERRRAGRRG